MYLPREINPYMKALIMNMSFEESIKLSLSFYKESKENSDDLSKALLYPLILLFITLSAIYLFDAYGLDAIMEMLKSFDSDIKSFTVMRVILRIIVYIFYYGMLIMFVLALYFLNDKNISLFYILMSKYFPDSIVQVYFCEQFISMFLICYRLGYKTKESIEILNSLHTKPIVSLLSFHMEEKLLKGATLKEASVQKYYDSTLTKYLNIALLSRDFNRILSDYVTLSKRKIKRKIKQLSSVVQISSYVGVGLVIVFIYQVLFLPMQALSNF